MKTKLKTELPPMTATGKRRLRKLIAFLRKLKREQFDINIIKCDEEKCGTVACIIGWTPAVFPKLVRWGNLNDDHIVVLLKKRMPMDVGTVDLIAAELFGIFDEQTNIFYSQLQHVAHPRLPVLEGRATPKQAATMLEAYISLTETPAK